jgi:hypothetical protein
MGVKVGRRLSPAVTEGASMLPGYAGRYYGVGAFPQGDINIVGNLPRTAASPAPAAQVAQAAAVAPSPQVQQALTPLGQTRPLLAYGVPAAAGLALGGMLANQGEGPGTAAVVGTAAALGTRGALGAARLAGRYAPRITEAIQGAVVPVGKAVVNMAEGLPQGGKRMQAVEQMAQGLRGIYKGAKGITPGMVQKTAAVGAVPAGALLAGIGGVAAASIPGAMGVPGFQAQMPINPEGYGSSNSPSIYPTTLQY